MSAEHRLPVRVYLEDTDAQGIVYHANYLKYCERARTEMFLALGVPVTEVGPAGLRFVVHEMSLKYQQPARLFDTLEVRSTAARVSEYRVTFQHRVYTTGALEQLCMRAEAQVVAIGADGKLRELPPGVF